MNDPSPTLEELLADPAVSPHVPNESFDVINTHLANKFAEQQGNSISRFFAGFGAWISAICMLVFLAANRVFNDPGSTLVIGLMMAGGAIALNRLTKATFPGELGLALAISGNIAIVISSVMDQNEGLPIAIVTHAFAGTLLYLFFANATYRFLAPLALSALTTIWFFTERELAPFFHVIIVGQMFLLGLLYLRMTDRLLLRPLAHAMTVALPGTFIFLNLWELDLMGDRFELSLWPSNFIVGLALLYLCHHVAADREWWSKRAGISTAVAIVLLTAFTTPGLMVALGLLVLGRHAGESRVQTLAHAFLITFLWFYYYALNVDLAYKSFVVIGTGVVLLGLRKLFSEKTQTESIPA